MNHRIECIRERLQLAELDGMIISNPLSIKYIIGINVEGTILITSKENILITDARYIEDVNNTITLEDEISVRNCANILEEEYLEFFSDCNRVGFEENYITYANYNNMIRRYRIKEAVETNHFIEKQRMIKSDDEIEKIKNACIITDSCFYHLLEYIKVGMTEKQVALEIYNFFINHGADGLAFDTIVASGENSSKPHAVPTDKKIEKGDVIVIDFGAKYQGYCADMTRTIFVGEPTDEIKELYKLILDGQTRATEKIKDGADGRDIANGIQNEYKANNFELIHALGHGVGLEVHELPYLSYRTNYIMHENMVVTNEPGIYIPGKIGIRIEDTVLVKRMQSESLTKAKKQLTVI